MFWGEIAHLSWLNSFFTCPSYSDDRLCPNTRISYGYEPCSVWSALLRFCRSRSAFSASEARFLLALSALILAWSGVGGLMISVIRIKYLARRSRTGVPPNLTALYLAVPTVRTLYHPPCKVSSNLQSFNRSRQAVDLIDFFSATF